MQWQTIAHPGGWKWMSRASHAASPTTPGPTPPPGMLTKALCSLVLLVLPSACPGLGPFTCRACQSEPRSRYHMLSDCPLSESLSGPWSPAETRLKGQWCPLQRLTAVKQPSLQGCLFRYNPRGVDLCRSVLLACLPGWSRSSSTTCGHDPLPFQVIVCSKNDAQAVPIEGLAMQHGCNNL